MIAASNAGANNTPNTTASGAAVATNTPQPSPWAQNHDRLPCAGAAITSQAWQ